MSLIHQINIETLTSVHSLYFGKLPTTALIEEKQSGVFCQAKNWSQLSFSLFERKSTLERMRVHVRGYGSVTVRLNHAERSSNAFVCECFWRCNNGSTLDSLDIELVFLSEIYEIRPP